MDHLATLLLDRAKIERGTVGWRMPGLLEELAPRDGKQFVIAVGFALGDRPVTLVAGRVERAAGVRQKHLQRALMSSEEEDAGAASGGHGRDGTAMRPPYWAAVHAVRLPEAR
jgi:hypothetical protein